MCICKSWNDHGQNQLPSVDYTGVYAVEKAYKLQLYLKNAR